MRGFDRQNADTMGDITYTAGTQTFSIAPKAGSHGFYFWAGDVYYEKTTAQSTTFADATGSYYFYFDTAGNLQSILSSAWTEALFTTVAICGMCYYNAVEGTLWYAKDEQHGVDHPASVHFYDHLTRGFVHAQGGAITGLADGSDDYTSVGASVHFDEDIVCAKIATSTHYFMYRSGAAGGWKLSAAANNKVALMNGANAQYNQYTGGAWQLTDCANVSDYVIMYFLQTNLNGNPSLVKIVGQQFYASRALARAALKYNLQTIKLAGLPGAECEFQFAYIIKKNGDLEDNENEAYLDLRGVPINAVN